MILQVDDSLITGSQSFLNDQDTESIAFLSNPRQLLIWEPMLFNGLEIFLKDEGQLFTIQDDKIIGLSVLTMEKGFISQGALVQYIWSQLQDLRLHRSSVDRPE